MRAQRKLMPKIKYDSDKVHDLGLPGIYELKRAKKDVHYHYIKDGSGYVKVICGLTKHEYYHIINSPNKFALICRGCGATI